MIGKDKVLEVGSYYIRNGKQKTLEAFDLTEETFNRYKREFKKVFGDNFESLVKINESFSGSELKTVRA
jgi:ABC-type sulfate transport system substrate-binding protein